MDFFYCDPGLKKPTEDLTEAIHYAGLSCFKQLPNVVTFVRFTYKNLFILVTLKNSHNN